MRSPLSRRVAIQADAIELDRQCVARNRAFHVERTGFRIPAVRAPLVRGVAAARIHGSGPDRVARIDVQGGRNGSGKEAMELRGREIAGLGSCCSTRRAVARSTPWFHRTRRFSFHFGSLRCVALDSRPTSRHSAAWR